MGINIDIAGIQQLGMRKEQQDVWDTFSMNDTHFAVVADGMGGMKNGRASALLAVETVRSFIEQNKDEDWLLSDALEAASLAVSKQADLDGNEGQTGSTMVIAYVRDGKLFWASTGDSRLYLIRKGKLLQLSRDHSFSVTLSKLVACNKEVPSAPFEHPQRRSLTSWLGCGKLKHMDISDTPLELKPGDLILLCSDGCYDSFSLDMPIKTGSAYDIADQLVSRAIMRRNPHQDNATCIVMLAS